MPLNITRRNAIKSGIAAAGLTAGVSITKKAEAYNLQETWGEDFLTPWSPYGDIKRDLTPGKTPIRLSCTSHGLHYKKDMDFEAAVKNIRALGYTAAEGGEEWKDASDAEIKTIVDLCKKYDVMFYALHMCINNIHPDLTERQKNLKRVAKLVETADRMGFAFVVTHTGSCGNSPTETHRDNWSKSTWETSVKSMKQIIKDTSGSKVNLAVEALNPCNINNPRAHMKLKEDVGDERVKVTLDPTNMLNPSTYYRTTELINECFDLIGEDVMYAHAKVDKYPQAKKFIEDTAARVGVKIYS